MAPNRSSAGPSISIRTPKLAPLVVAFALALFVVLVAARPASATNEFPTNAGASIYFNCDGLGPYVAVTVTNVDGLDTAEFTIALTGRADEHVVVAPNQHVDTETIRLTEGQGYTATITETDGFSKVESIDAFDCYGATGTITLTCDGDQPLLTATYQQTKTALSTVTLDRDGTTQTSDEAEHTFTSPVAEDAAFDATLSTPEDGPFAHLAGTADCVHAVTTTTTTVPATVPPTTEPPVVIAQVAAPAAPTPAAPTELPRTGSNDALLAALGTALVGSGVGLRRLAHRSARA